MNFLAAGFDVSVIALWLRHVDTHGTDAYLHADMTIKQTALDRTRREAPNLPARTRHFGMAHLPVGVLVVGHQPGDHRDGVSAGRGQQDRGASPAHHIAAFLGFVSAHDPLQPLFFRRGQQARANANAVYLDEMC